jgi:hypothetical protein
MKPVWRGDEEKNSQPLPGFDLSIIHPVALRYTTELSRIPGLSKDNETNSSRETICKKKRIKCRKYDTKYLLDSQLLMLGGPQCLLCLEVLAADSVKQNKLETFWKSACWMCWKSSELFYRKLNDFNKQIDG